MLFKEYKVICFYKTKFFKCFLNGHILLLKQKDRQTYENTSMAEIYKNILITHFLVEIYKVGHFL